MLVAKTIVVILQLWNQISSTSHKKFQIILQKIWNYCDFWTKSKENSY